jgi:hypothetical protein
MLIHNPGIFHGFDFHAINNQLARGDVSDSSEIRLGLAVLLAREIKVQFRYPSCWDVDSQRLTIGILTAELLFSNNARSDMRVVHHETCGYIDPMLPNDGAVDNCLFRRQGAQHEMARLIRHAAGRRLGDPGEFIVAGEDDFSAVDRFAIDRDDSRDWCVADLLRAAPNQADQSADAYERHPIPKCKSRFHVAALASLILNID